jgi:hypothetical protein
MLLIRLSTTKIPCAYAPYRMRMNSSEVCAYGTRSFATMPSTAIRAIWKDKPLAHQMGRATPQRYVYAAAITLSLIHLRPVSVNSGLSLT